LLSPGEHQILIELLYKVSQAQRIEVAAAA